MLIVTDADGDDESSGYSVGVSGVVTDADVVDESNTYSVGVRGAVTDADVVDESDTYSVGMSVAVADADGVDGSSGEIDYQRCFLVVDVNSDYRSHRYSDHVVAVVHRVCCT